MIFISSSGIGLLGEQIAISTGGVTINQLLNSVSESEIIVVVEQLINKYNTALTSTSPGSQQKIIGLPTVHLTAQNSEDKRLWLLRTWNIFENGNCKERYLLDLCEQPNTPLSDEEILAIILPLLHFDTPFLYRGSLSSEGTIKDILDRSNSTQIKELINILRRQREESEIVQVINNLAGLSSKSLEDLKQELSLKIQSMPPRMPNDQLSPLELFMNILACKFPLVFDLVNWSKPLTMLENTLSLLVLQPLFTPWSLAIQKTTEYERSSSDNNINLQQIAKAISMTQISNSLSDENKKILHQLDRYFLPRTLITLTNYWLFFFEQLISNNAMKDVGHMMISGFLSHMYSLLAPSLLKKKMTLSKYIGRPSSMKSMLYFAKELVNTLDMGKQVHNIMIVGSKPFLSAFIYILQSHLKDYRIINVNLQDPNSFFASSAREIMEADFRSEFADDSNDNYSDMGWMVRIKKSLFDVNRYAAKSVNYRAEINCFLYNFQHSQRDKKNLKNFANVSSLLHLIPLVNGWHSGSINLVLGYSQQADIDPALLSRFTGINEKPLSLREYNLLVRQFLLDFKKKHEELPFNHKEHTIEEVIRRIAAKIYYNGGSLSRLNSTMRFLHNMMVKNKSKYILLETLLRYL